MSTLFTSVNGTKRRFRNVRYPVAIGGKADVLQTSRCRLDRPWCTVPAVCCKRTSSSWWWAALHQSIRSLGARCDSLEN